jgi:hypothetical protein
MSLILDALKRSQQERQDSDGVPGIATAHYHESAPVHRSLQLLPWLALAVALAAVGWLLLERATRDDSGVAKVGRSGSESSEIVQPARVSDQVEPGGATMGAKPPASYLPARGTEGGVTERAGTPVQPLDSPQVTPAVGISANAMPAADRQRQPASVGGASDPAVIALYHRRSTGVAVERDAAAGPVDDKPPPAGGRAAPGQTEDNTTLDVEALVERVETGIAQQGLSEHSAPFLSALSQASKDAIPSLFYSKHDYARSGRSTVVLNGKVLGEGDTVNGEIKVEEILDDSVVLDYRGTRFRLKALNSWVNL